MATKVFTGARAIFNLYNKIIALAAGVDGGEEIAYEPVEVLNNLYVEEFAPVGVRTTLSSQIFRTVGDGETVGSLKKLGVFPKEISPPTDLGGPDHEVFTVPENAEALIVDRVSKNIVGKFVGVKTASYNFSISPRGVVGQNVNFVVRYMRDESKLS